MTWGEVVKFHILISCCSLTVLCISMETRMHIVLAMQKYFHSSCVIIPHIGRKGNIRCDKDSKWNSVPVYYHCPLEDAVTFCLYTHVPMAMQRLETLLENFFFISFQRCRQFAMSSSPFYGDCQFREHNKVLCVCG